MNIEGYNLDSLRKLVRDLQAENAECIYGLAEDMKKIFRSAKRKWMYCQQIHVKILE